MKGWDNRLEAETPELCICASEEDNMGHVIFSITVEHT